MSTIIGFVGGGGIGFLLQQWINLLKYNEAGTALFAIGPCNIQGIQDKNGTFFFTDLNLRFGSGSVHTIAAGGNIPLMIYQEMAGQDFLNLFFK